MEYNNRRLEKFTLPAPSTGRGALWIAGDFMRFQQAIKRANIARRETDLGHGDSAICIRFEVGALGGWSANEPYVAAKIDHIGMSGNSDSYLQIFSGLMFLLKLMVRK